MIPLGLGVSTISRANVVTPEEPEAYESFIIEIDIPDLYAYDSPQVDVESNEILLLHMETAEINTLPPSEMPVVVEVQGLPPGSYAIKTVELPPYELDGEPVVYDKGLTVVVAEAALPQKA